jgi:hypothetical protein
MENWEYFIRRAWDCYRLADRSPDQGIAKLMRDAERTFVNKAIDIGVPRHALPPSGKPSSASR